MSAVAVSRVCFGYGRELLFDRLSCEVGEGEFFGIIGPNGAGKSTLLRIAAGLLRPGRGRVELFGRDLSALSRRDTARLCGTVLPEEPFAFDFTVEEVVLMGRHPHLGLLARPGRADRERVESALGVVDCAGLAHKGINSISTGEKQRVLLARALAQEPRLLLLDEALSHLDIAHQVAMGRALGQLNRKGITVILLSHDLNLAAQLCSRIMLLCRGAVAACDVPERVVTAELIERVYGVRPLVTAHPETGRPQLLLPA